MSQLWLWIVLGKKWERWRDTSLNEVVTSSDSAKVTYVAMSKYYTCPNWNRNAQDSCEASCSEKGGSMEVAHVETTFQHSLSWYNVRYISFLGDGDSKAWSTVEPLESYGNDVAISKPECVCHVQKHMGMCLCQLERDCWVIGYP